MKELCDLVLVAGGTGTRFGASKPKQFEIIGGKPVYRWSLDVFAAWSHIGEIVIVVPTGFEGQIAAENSIRSPAIVTIKKYGVIGGGGTRQESATRGLEFLRGRSHNKWVMIHDAARPCVTADLLDRLWTAGPGQAAAAEWLQDVGGIVPGLPSDQSNGVGRVVDGVAIQTPQLFRSGLLEEAYRKFRGQAAADDASLLEQLGRKIVVVGGDYDNLKITFIEDKARVSDWLRNRHT